MSYQGRHSSSLPFSGPPRRCLDQIIALLRHPYADTGIVAGILIVVVAALLWPALTSPPREVPNGANLIVGQQQGIFYLAQPAPNHTSDLYVRRDGLNWHRLPTALPGSVHTLAINPVIPPIMYAATSAGLYVTSDGGLNWNTVEMPPGAITALATDPSTADMVYVATDEPALYHMTDVGTSHQRVAAHGLSGQQIRQLAVSPDNSQVVLAITDEGLFRSGTAGERWTRVENAPAHVTTLVAVPGDSFVWVAGTADAGVYRSLNDGRTWQAGNAGIIPSPGLNGPTVTALMVDPGQPGRLYLATAGDRGGTVTPAIYVSADAGESWVKLHDVAPGSGIITAVLPVSPTDVRAVMSDGVRTYSIDVERTLARLDSPDAAERLHAARLLSVTAQPAQALALLNHLDDPDPDVGLYLKRALVRTEGQGVLLEIVRHTQAGAPLARRRAVDVLGELRAADAVPALAHILRTDADLAPASAEALARIGSDQAWHALRLALRSDSSDVRRKAAVRAFQSAGESAVPALVTALDDGDALVRVRAATLLADIDSPRAIPALRHLLDDQSAQVQAAASHALGLLGDANSRPVLAKLADTDDTKSVRHAAAQAITQIDENPRLLPTDAVEYEPPAGPADVWRAAALFVPWIVIMLLLFVRYESDNEEVQRDGVESCEMNREVL